MRMEETQLKLVYAARNASSDCLKYDLRSFLPLVPLRPFLSLSSSSFLPPLTLSNLFSPFSLLLLDSPTRTGVICTPTYEPQQLQEDILIV